MRSKTYDGKIYAGGAELRPILVDVLNPLVVVIQSIGGDPDDFDVTFSEVGSSTTQTNEFAAQRMINPNPNLRATSASSVVHTGVKSPGCEKRTACIMIINY